MSQHPQNATSVCSQKQVYLDANATTPVLPEVRDAMVAWLDESFGNASSGHSHGRKARSAVEGARQQVAALLNCRGMEIVFTSGGTEADNLAVFGAVSGPGAHVITTPIEHHAVLHAVQAVQQTGCEVTYVPVDKTGRVSPADVSAAIRPNTRLITIMAANNETGVIQPVEEIGAIAREHGVLFHTDAVQTAGKVPLDVERIGCDLLSISAHKMHGPQGVGALYIRHGIDIEPMFHGGNHEAGLRAGTENVAGIVGFGCAASAAMKSLQEDMPARLSGLRNWLEREILLASPNAFVNGAGAERVPNTTNICFSGRTGYELLMALDDAGISVSGGSACTTGARDGSHVLLAMGLSPSDAGASLRFSLSKLTTAEEIEYAIEQLNKVLSSTTAPVATLS